MNEETLLYILHIPKLEDEISTAIMIMPLIINNTIISKYPQHLIKTNKKLYSTTNNNNFVQKQSDIQEFEDNCIKPLVMGTKSHCKVRQETETTLQFVAENKLVISNAKNETLSSDCGPDNRTLEGNFLLSFWNCTITFKNKKFQSFEIKGEAMEIQGAFHNLEATRQLITELNVDEIAQTNIENRKRLQKVYLKQIDHQTWIWSLSGGVSFSSFCIITAIIYICLRKQATTVNVDTENKSWPEELRKSYADLLTEVKIKAKDEDALSSPPGGVIRT